MTLGDAIRYLYLQLREEVGSFGDGEEERTPRDQESKHLVPSKERTSNFNLHMCVCMCVILTNGNRAGFINGFTLFRLTYVLKVK